MTKTSRGLTTWLTAGAFGLVAVSLGGGLLSAQDTGTAKPTAKPKSTKGATEDSSSAKKKPAKGSEEDSKSEKKPFGGPGPRLPPYWGKLELPDEQREKVLAIQEKHRKKINELRAALEKAESERDNEMLAALTPAQREELTKLKAAAKKKAAPKTDSKKT
jgi:Spy/CpxP family protein refolding chaperone